MWCRLLLFIKDQRSYSDGEDEMRLRGSYVLFFFAGYKGLENFLVQRRSLARDSVDMAPSPLGNCDAPVYMWIPSMPLLYIEFPEQQVNSPCQDTCLCPAAPLSGIINLFHSPNRVECWLHTVTGLGMPGGYLPARNGPAQSERAGPRILRRRQTKEQAHHSLAP